MNPIIYIIYIPRDLCIQNFGRIPNLQKKTGTSPQEWRNAENMAQFHKNGAMEILHRQGRRNHGKNGAVMGKNGAFQHQNLKPYGYESIPINTSFSGMNIHLPAIFMFTRGTRF